MTEEQTSWLNNWLTGLRNGTLTAAAGFIAKLGGMFDVSVEDRAALTDLYVQHGVLMLCDVVEDFLDAGDPLQTVLARHLS